MNKQRQEELRNLQDALKRNNTDGATTPRTTTTPSIPASVSETTSSTTQAAPAHTFKAATAPSGIQANRPELARMRTANASTTAARAPPPSDNTKPTPATPPTVTVGPGKPSWKERLEQKRVAQQPQPIGPPRASTFATPKLEKRKST